MNEAWIVMRGLSVDGETDAGFDTCVPLAFDDIEGSAIGAVLIAVCGDGEMAYGAIREAIDEREAFIKRIEVARLSILAAQGKAMQRHKKRLSDMEIAGKLSDVPPSPRDPTLTWEQVDRARYFILGPAPVFVAR